MKYKENCEIIKKEITGHYLYLKMKTYKIASEALPGQFINIRISDTYDPLLRRPMSVCDAGGDELSVLVLIKGRGTELLSEKKAGDKLNIIGPLGNAFPLTKKKGLFIAGGTGIAPFLFLSKKLAGSTLLFGVRSSEWLPDLKPFEKNCKIIIASEDGSIGEKGTVVDLAMKYDLNEYAIYACGPNPMFNALNVLLNKKPGCEAYYSVETIMGCGFGVCKGCSVETHEGGYKLVCTDGPVFSWNEVKL